MKQLLRRVVVKDGVAIKQLPYVIEHDAIKAFYTESERQEIPISQEYKVRNEIASDAIIVFNITIKWMDGESSNVTITEFSGDEFFNFVYMSFENVYNAEMNHSLESEEEEEDVDDEDDPDENQLRLAFPTSIK